MNYEDLFYKNIYVLMDQIKASGLLGLNVSEGKKSVKFVIPKDEKTYDYLLKLEEYGLIESLIKHSSKNKFDDSYTFLTCPMFDGIFTSLEKLLDDPFLAPTERFKKIKALFNKKVTKENTKLSKNTFTYGKLSLDVSKGILIYDGCRFSISPELHVTRFLLILIKAKGEIVSYEEIFKEIGKSMNDDEVRTTNMDYAKDVQYIKRETRKCLMKTANLGHSKKDCVNKLIDSIKPVFKKGYKLVQ